MVGLLVATGCSILVTVLTLWTASRRSSQSKMRWAIAIGTAAGHIAWTAMNELASVAPSAGLWHVVRNTIATFAAPREAGHWIVIVLVVVAIAESLSGDGQIKGSTGNNPPRPSHNGRTLLIRSLIYVGVLLRLLWGSVYLTRQWSVPVTIGIVTLNALVLSAIATAGQHAVAQRILAMRLSLITLVSTSIGLVIGMSGSAVYAQLSLVLTASLFICTLFAWRQPRGAGHDALPSGMIVLAVAYHLWLAHFFAELTLVNGTLLMASLASGFCYGWRNDSKAAWIDRVLPSVLAISLSLAAVANAGIVLARALANPLGY